MALDDQVEKVKAEITSWKAYQNAALDLAFESARTSEYLVAGLAGEAGEFAELCDEWLLAVTTEAEDAEWADLYEPRLCKELGDVLWFAAMLAKMNGGEEWLHTAIHITLPTPSTNMLFKTCCRSTAMLVFNARLSAQVGVICSAYAKYHRDDKEACAKSFAWFNEKCQTAVQIILGLVQEFSVATLNSTTALQLAQINIGKLWDRRERNKLQGSGDNR